MSFEDTDFVRNDKIEKNNSLLKKAIIEWEKNIILHLAAGETIVISDDDDWFWDDDPQKPVLVGLPKKNPLCVEYFLGRHENCCKGCPLDDAGQGCDNLDTPYNRFCANRDLESAQNFRNNLRELLQKEKRRCFCRRW